MIYAILVYLICSSFFVGQYWGDVFENESVWYKIRFSFLLFVFAPAIFILKYLFIGVGKIVPERIKFYYKFYILKEFDNLGLDMLRYLNKTVELGKCTKFYKKEVGMINKRNNYTP